MKHERETYRGHRIELVPPDSHVAADPQLFIDKEQIGYGRLPDGQYFLHDHAYEWSASLTDLAQRLVDYRSRVAEVRHGHEADRGE